MITLQEAVDRLAKELWVQIDKYVTENAIFCPTMVRVDDTVEVSLNNGKGRSFCVRIERLDSAIVVADLTVSDKHDSGTHPTETHQ